MQLQTGKPALVPRPGTPRVDLTPGKGHADIPIRAKRDLSNGAPVRACRVSRTGAIAP